MEAHLCGETWPKVNKSLTFPQIKSQTYLFKFQTHISFKSHLKWMKSFHWVSMELFENLDSNLDDTCHTLHWTFETIHLRWTSSAFQTMYWGRWAARYNEFSKGIPGLQVNCALVLPGSQINIILSLYRLDPFLPLLTPVSPVPCSAATGQHLLISWWHATRSWPQSWEAHGTQEIG